MNKSTVDKTIKSMSVAEDNYNRYQDVKGRGHSDYIDKAIRNEEFYLGDGKQWRDEDRTTLTELGRPVIEDNQVFPAVNTAVGMQVKSRVDISYKPRSNDATEQTAHTLTQIAMQVCDEINYQWLETQVFSDGLIQQRGYFDFRITFDENMLGTIEARDLDPLDVLPDPDANQYDPKTWSDVIVIRWMTLDDIEQTYGKSKRDEVKNASPSADAGGDDYQDRNSFGDRDVYINASGSSTFTDGGKKYLVIDRQWRKMSFTEIVVASTGDIFIKDQLSEEQLNKAVAEGAVITKKMMKRIMWTVSTETVELHNEWSPYKTFTVMAYFPYFRRGKTLGMVDNAKSPQEFLNKNLSLYQYIVAGISNSGWVVEEDSLVGMTIDDLEDFGSKSGVVIQHKKGTAPPRKIDPPKPPSGIDRMIERATNSIKTTTGMSDDLRGLDGSSVSGISREIKNYQGANTIAGAMDNLARTQYYVAEKLLELIQGYYTENRVLMITDKSVTNSNKYKQLEINIPLDDGTYFNDITIGQYDVVVSTKPVTDTFRDNQWNQAKELRSDMGVAIPDASMIEMSSLSKKDELIEAIKETQGQQVDPEQESRINERAANAALKLATTDKVKADTVGILVDAKYSAVQTAGAITENKEVTPMADILLRSSGDIDKDQAPLVPSFPVDQNTMINPNEQTDADRLAGGFGANYDPTTPVPAPTPGDPEIKDIEPEVTGDPTTGVRKGIETQEFDG